MENLAKYCYEPPMLRPEQEIIYKYYGTTVYANYKCTSYPDAVSTPSCAVSRCSVPETWTEASLSCSAQDCMTRPGQYYGKVGCTVTGRKCQKWNSNWPHRPAYWPADTNNNYCSTLPNTAIPWCYTMDPNIAERRIHSTRMLICIILVVFITDIASTSGKNKRPFTFYNRALPAVTTTAKGKNYIFNGNIDIEITLDKVNPVLICSALFKGQFVNETTVTVMKWYTYYKDVKVINNFPIDDIGCKGSLQILCTLLNSNITILMNT
ncbi:MST1 [Mytilus coruscus]|uniref:MST1 n=1 Tax=Mytilus coruscus TaxID=42192 RepID=A0A6J7ZVJ7_MYTCO|nr:MST1 [Mytilus coruscus]